MILTQKWFFSGFFELKKTQWVVGKWEKGANPGKIRH
jgi:hypothetical protein